MQRVRERLVVKSTIRCGYVRVRLATVVVEAGQRELLDGRLERVERRQQSGQRRMGQRLLTQRAQQETEGHSSCGPSKAQLATDAVDVEDVLTGRTQLDAGCRAQRLRVADGA